MRSFEDRVFDQAKYLYERAAKGTSGGSWEVQSPADKAPWMAMSVQHIHLLDANADSVLEIIRKKKG